MPDDGYRCLEAAGGDGDLDGIGLDTADGDIQSIEGHAVEDGTGVPGHLSVTLGAKAFAAPYWIIIAGPVVNDKYDFIIVTDMLQVTMWVLVRDLDRYFEKYDADVQVQLQELGFTQLWNSPIRTNQTGCEYPTETQTKEEADAPDVFYTEF